MPVLNYGGCGQRLALSVKAYAAFPETAAENAIGILSAVPVTKYVFSAAAPETGLTEGLTWIRTAAESTTPIPLNAKKNVILYPVAAAQVQGGLWVPVEARCYRGGEWRVWMKPLYTSGTRDVAWSRESGTRVVWDGDRIDLGNAGGTADTALCTTDLLDLSAYRRLKVECAGLYGSQTTSRGRVFAGIAGAGGSVTTEQPDILSAQLAYTTTRQIVSIDLSPIDRERYASGAVKFFYNAGTNGNSIRIYRIWLEG